MESRNDNLNNKMEPKTSSEFRADLKSIFELDVSIPAEIDQKILGLAAKRLGKNGKTGRIILIRWAGRVAAVAAVIFIVVMLHTSFYPNSLVQQRLATYQPTLAEKEDVDQSGRTDILDAFALARDLKAGKAHDPKYDFNGDGVIDEKDVDVVALAAVRLPGGKTL